MQCALTLVVGQVSKVQQPLSVNYFPAVNFFTWIIFIGRKFIILIWFKVDYIGRRIFVSNYYCRF